MQTTQRSHRTTAIHTNSTITLESIANARKHQKLIWIHQKGNTNIGRRWMYSTLYMGEGAWQQSWEWTCRPTGEGGGLRQQPTNILPYTV